MPKETASSKLCPRLYGEIVRWIDYDYFIVRCGGREMIGSKAYWRVGYAKRTAT
jgi:hypothetical protein